MSKYPVAYTSASKGPVDIESMHDLHLLNAYRKLETDPDADMILVECMLDELKSRGLDPQYGNGRPPEDQEDPL